jgi:hypothetical protein
MNEFGDSRVITALPLRLHTAKARKSVAAVICFPPASPTKIRFELQFFAAHKYLILFG